MIMQINWTPWPGGKCPLDCCDIIDIKLREGKYYYNVYPDGWDWIHTGGDMDIVEYRIVGKLGD